MKNVIEIAGVDLHARFVVGTGARVVASVSVEEPGTRDLGAPAAAPEVRYGRPTRDLVDFITGKPIPSGVECLWVEGRGVTQVLQAEWPENLRTETDGNFFAAARAQPSASSAAKTRSTAADILGGSGGHLDRSDGLAGGLEDD